MSMDRDSIRITPRIAPRDSGPRRRAIEARATEQAEQKHGSVLAYLRDARRLQAMRAARAATRGPSAATRGARVGSRLAGTFGAALLIMDAVNAVGSTVRRAEQGVSGRLLEAMDQNTIYGQMDEIATGVAQGRGSIEGQEDLLKVIGRQGRINAQIGRLGAWFRTRETARAIGADLIEREPGFDHLESIADKVIDGAKSGLKSAADRGVNAIRSFYGKEAIAR